MLTESKRFYILKDNTGKNVCKNKSLFLLKVYHFRRMFKDVCNVACLRICILGI